MRRPRGAGGGTRTLTGLPPTDFRTSYGFRRRHTGVCGLDYTFTLAFAAATALGAARLVSTPSLSGLARDCHLTGFPDFEQFCVPGFPRAHSNDLQVRCVYHSATPAYFQKSRRPLRGIGFQFGHSGAPRSGEPGIQTASPSCAAAWIPGSREDARPGMTILAERDARDKPPHDGFRPEAPPHVPRSRPSRRPRGR
jgi:hypothetical protein